jgi:hypothetical protein
MPDIHIPKLDWHGSGHSIFKILFEVVLIGTGVFLGLAGEQWRERAHQRELAEQALRRFRSEIVENRKSVAIVADYHVTMKKTLEMAKSADDVQFAGIRPSNFDHSAWDLAIATQSLSYIDADLALSLSRVYNTQESVMELTRGVLQAMYIAPPTDSKNAKAFFGAVLVYYGDMTIYEPQLLQLYDAILPRIAKTLGEKPGEKK